MCGHIGVMGKKLSGNSDEQMMEEGLYICALRGMDSVGLGYVPVDPNEKPYVTKRLGRPPVYIKMPGKGAKCVIGHVRSATIGNRDSLELAHPFHFDNIIGAHNGTLRYDWRWNLEEGTNEKFGSDSQGVFFNFAYNGVEETIKKLHGAWCFVWWDDDEQTLNILRNDERPLWLARGKSGNLYWASEYWMIQGMVRAGEKKRDTFVADPTTGKLFNMVPVNQWLRFQHDDEGNVVALDPIPLEGAPPPPPSPVAERPAGGTGGFVWCIWDNGNWTEVPEGTKGAARLSRSYADSSDNVTRLPAGDGKSDMWRTVAGVHYVCARPGAKEIRFDELVEFHTDGACLQCGTVIGHPRAIGYLPNDYSYIACRSCCREWIEDEWVEHGTGTEELKEKNPDLAALIDDLFPPDKMVTMGKPPADDSDLADPPGKLDPHLAALNVTLDDLNDALPPSLLPKKPMRYALYKKKGKKEQRGHGCRSHDDMVKWCRSLPDYEIRTVPITAADKKRLAIIIPVEEKIVPVKSAQELSRAALLPANKPSTPPRTVLSAPSKYAGGLGKGWAWWNDGPRSSN